MVSTHLKNISQILSFPQIGVNIKIFKTTTWYIIAPLLHILHMISNVWYKETQPLFLEALHLIPANPEIQNTWLPGSKHNISSLYPVIKEFHCSPYPVISTTTPLQLQKNSNAWYFIIKSWQSPTLDGKVQTFATKTRSNKILSPGNSTWHDSYISYVCNLSKTPPPIRVSCHENCRLSSPRCSAWGKRTGLR